MSTTPGKLTDRKMLIFDVYGTLMDWETGLYDALKPLLLRYKPSRNWTRKEALTAFGSVELDLQTQFPDMLYADLLAKVHEVLEQRLKALSSKDTSSSTLDGGEPKEPEGAETAAEGASASTSASTGSDETKEASSDAAQHKAFGDSIKNWSIFPDTSAALHSLAKHYKLVVLSNVDRDSFQYTHGVLSEGRTPSDPSPYLYPGNKTTRFWQPQTTAAAGKSPFTLILTAQDTGCYKPSLGGFQTALEYIKSSPDLLGGTLKDGEDVEDKVLVVAQSLTHDHVPASQLGVRSVWIDRQAAVMCNELPGGAEPYSWKFETMGEFAKAVEEEAAQ
ncbi:haloacid dehalogenase [Ephemerocybe angulata]|uniref:Haloacid dehalogenase n=1 Tax=Ephemerocybe angulata TaxID=980116 RepID=A0A8H6LUV4_9AGAR|nr:haloacid dehalogenase [Tulosesus angulatus]